MFVCHSQGRTHTPTACVPAVARAAFISGPWLVGKCFFPCWSSDSHSLWRTQHSLSLFPPLCLLFCCTLSSPATLPPLFALLLSLSCLLSNYHGIPQPLHYIQAVVTVYLQHLLPLFGTFFNRFHLFYLTEMTRPNARPIRSKLYVLSG